MFKSTKLHKMKSLDNAESPLLMQNSNSKVILAIKTYMLTLFSKFWLLLFNTTI